MRAMKLAGAFLAAAMPVAQPCLAAEDFRDLGTEPRRTAAFAGASLRIPLGTARPAAPAARLQLGLAHPVRDGRGPRPALFELGATRFGKPAFYVGGREVGETRRRLGISGDSGWVVPALIIGAVVVGVVLLTDPSSDAPAAP
jgi:hypothetical protein